MAVTSPLADTRAATVDDGVVEVRDLRMRYGAHEVLRGVDLSLRRGEVVALLGPNGAGKTTCIEILEGFRRRTGGEVRVLGADPEHGGEAWRAELGIVLQSWGDHGRWRVGELLAHLGRYYRPFGTPGRPRPIDVDELLATVGLSAQSRTKVLRLSGGQRRRLDVAIGLVGRPRLLFLDEPTTGFDPEARRDFHELVHRLADLEDTSVLLTTHDLAEAEKLADRVLVLAGGRIVADGSAESLARQVEARAEVRWVVDGAVQVHATDDPTAFVRHLVRQHGDALGEVDVRRASLEDAYLALVAAAQRDRDLTVMEGGAR